MLVKISILALLVLIVTMLYAIIAASSPITPEERAREDQEQIEYLRKYMADKK